MFFGAAVSLCDIFFFFFFGRSVSVCSCFLFFRTKKIKINLSKFISYNFFFPTSSKSSLPDCVPIASATTISSKSSLFLTWKRFFSPRTLPWWLPLHSPFCRRGAHFEDRFVVVVLKCFLRTRNLFLFPRGVYRSSLVCFFVFFFLSPFPILLVMMTEQQQQKKKNETLQHTGAYSSDEKIFFPLHDYALYEQAVYLSFQCSIECDAHESERGSGFHSPRPEKKKIIIK